MLYFALIQRIFLSVETGVFEPFLTLKNLSEGLSISTKVFIRMNLLPAR